MATTTEIMQSLPGRFRPKMAGNMRATINFDLTGSDGGAWVMTIDRGDCQVRSGTAEGPDATVTMAAADFVGINTGKRNASEIFWSGRIQVQGDMEAVIALAPIMGWQ
jgi:putative sterol carrier protein